MNKSRPNSAENPGVADRSPQRDPLTQKVDDGPASSAGESRNGWSASALPGIRPGMLLPRARPKATFFPFDAENVRYYYLARNGIFALCQHWNFNGAEVLFPSYFHGVELEALLAAGVHPRYYPVDSNMQVDVAQVVSRITPQTRAIYVIHYLGFPGPVEALREVCRERNLKLIEDCALALLSSLGAKPLGSFGDAAVFCLYKTLPVPSGGAMVLADFNSFEFATEPAPSRAAWSTMVSSLIEYYDRHGNPIARGVLNAARAIGKATFRRAGTEWVAVGGQHFEMERARLGMNRLNHTVLDGQDYGEIIRHRRQNFLYLQNALAKLSSPIFPDLPEGVCPLFYPIRIAQGKEELIARLAKRGVEAINFWSLSHAASPAHEFPESEELRRTILELPCHQDLREPDMQKIVEAVFEEWPSAAGAGASSVQEHSRDAE